MSNIYIDLYLEKMYSHSENIQSEINHLKSFSAKNIILDTQLINQLQTQLMEIKNDWFNFDCNLVGNNYYIKFNLIFHSLEINSYEKEIVRKMCTITEEFFTELIPIEEHVSDTNGSEIMDSIFKEDGMILSIEEGGVGIAADITELLTNERIDFKVIRHQQSQFEGGASGGFEEIVLFIAASAVSGITWDSLKGLLITNIGVQSQHFKTTLIDNYKFNRLRKIIAERVIEDHKDLMLTGFYKRDQEIALEFRALGTFEKRVVVICDNDYQIRAMKYEDK